MTDKKTDPADKIKAVKEKEQLFDDMEKVDISNLKMSDFVSIPRQRSRFVHPFEGYPMAPKIEIGTGKDSVKVSATFIVALDPKSEPEQDRSGHGISIINQATGIEEIKNLGTYHSRFLRVAGMNYDIVFDRVMDVEGSKLHYSIVKSHECRAQLMFWFNHKTETIEVDKRYLFLDGKQSGKLLRLFQLMIRPGQTREKMAAAVSGEIETTDDDLMKLPTEA